MHNMLKAIKKQICDFYFLRYGRLKLLKNCEKLPEDFIPEDAQCSETDATPIF